MCTEGAATKFEIDFEMLWQPFKKKFREKRVSSFNSSILENSE
jgi:hypothetical protein